MCGLFDLKAQGLEWWELRALLMLCQWSRYYEDEQTCSGEV